MKIKSVIMASIAVATLTLAGGNVANAKSSQTVKKSETSTKKEIKKVVYKVKSGDTLEKIADKYDLTYVKLYNANKSIDNPDMIDVGDKIRIPKKGEKLPKRFAEFNGLKDAWPAAAPAPATATAAQQYSYQSAAPAKASSHSYRGGSSAGNTYAWGYCTWYVKNKRPDMPNMLGNGGQWEANSGRASGTIAREGAVAEQAGHVAYVEWVSADRQRVKVSEMNYGGGIGQVHTRTVPASTFRYIY